MKLLQILVLAVATARAQSTILGDQFTVSTAPAAFATGMANVQQIKFSVIPGYCAKVYIGVSGMNKSTYEKVLKVLWPNCNGGFSEEFSIADPSGRDGLDPNTIYIAGDIANEKIAWSALRTGLTSGAIDGETPSGAINGSNPTFTLSKAPKPNTSLVLTRSGLVQALNTDYMLNGSTITFLSGTIPQTGDILRAWYRY